MELNSNKIRLKELEEIRVGIDQRIAAIKGEAGIDDYEDRIAGTIKTLGTLIDDRRKNEDKHALWGISFELRALLSEIFSTLSGLEE